MLDIFFTVVITMTAVVLVGFIVFMVADYRLSRKYFDLFDQKIEGLCEKLTAKKEEKKEEEKGIEDNLHFDPQDPRPERLRKMREDRNRRHVVHHLKALKCDPQYNEENNINVSYQGENFLIQFNGAFLRIWDLSWYATKNTDDDYPLLKDAVNYANFSFGPSIIMHSPDPDGRIILSSRLDVLFVPEQEDNAGYLGSLLDSFFAVKHALYREVTRLKENPQDRTLSDNPIGFDTASLSDPSSPQAN